MEVKKIEIKNLCPMIAVVSAGKTTILKVLLDINYLQESADITTKFVTIIRYNPEVGKKPKFFHLKLKKEGEDYIYLKDIKSEIKGGEKIMKKVIELNESLKIKDVSYDQLFYFLEIGEIIFFRR